LALLLGALPLLSAHAGGDGVPSAVQAHAAWSRATAAVGANAVGYLTLTNTASTPDRLIGAQCPIAPHAALHRMSNDAGVMRMRPIGGVDLPPGHAVTLDPAGDHLMLMGTTRRLAAGDHFTCTLRFVHAAPLGVDFAVRGAGAMPGMDMPMKTP
jgi:copper(I)-binding protein